MDIKCTECGSRDRFRLALPTWDMWAVDSTGAMIEKLRKCPDDDDDGPQPGYTVYCDKCDHEFIL